jgi:hypothetical protein
MHHSNGKFELKDEKITAKTEQVITVAENPY